MHSEHHYLDEIFLKGLNTMELQFPTTKPRQSVPPERRWCHWLDWQIPLWVKIVDWLFWGKD